MLARIKEDRRVLAAPGIDYIDADSLEFVATGSMSVGGFFWSLHFAWVPIPQHEKDRRTADTDPLRYDECIKVKGYP